MKPIIKVYICSPLSKGNIKENIKTAIKYGREAYRKGYFPIVPHSYTDIIAPHLKDDNPKERKEILKIGLILLSLCNEIWVFKIKNKVTKGMQNEINFAKKFGIYIKILTDKYQHKKNIK